MLSKLLSIVFLLLLLNPLTYAQSSKESSKVAPSQEVNSSSDQPSSEEKPIRAPSSRPTVKLSPNVRNIEQTRQGPVIPVEALQQFLIRPKIVAEDELETAGYVVANAEGSVFSSIGSKVYVRHLEKQVHENRFIVVAVGQPYRDPNNDNEVLAYEATYLGEGLVEPQKEASEESDEDRSDIVVLRITSSVREIEAGARVLPLEGRVINEDFYPHSPQQIEDAYIVGVMDNVAHISQYQVVVINQGSQEGIERGHWLAVNKSATIIKDQISDEEGVKLPSQRAGILLVFKVFERVSYALIMKAFLPIDLFDKVVIP